MKWGGEIGGGRGQENQQEGGEEKEEEGGEEKEEEMQLFLAEKRASDEQRKNQRQSRVHANFDVLPN